MNDIVLGKKDFDVFSQLLMWAYRHGISVTLEPYRSSVGSFYPELRFNIDDKFIRKSIYPIVDIEGRAKHIWAEVARKLLIEPFEYESFK